MKNQKLFNRALSIERFQTSVWNKESDHGISDDDWQDSDVLNELIYILKLYLEDGTCYQDALEHGTAQEKKEVRSEIAKLRRLISAYKNQ
jgi:hypothetical protein